MNFTMNSPSDLLFKVVTLIGYLVVVYWMYVAGARCARMSASLQRRRRRRRRHARHCLA